MATRTESGRPVSPLLKTTRFWLAAFGFDPRQLWYGLRGVPWFLADYARFRKMASDSQMRGWPMSLGAPCLGNRDAANGEIRGHYFLQDLLIARRIFERQPKVHIDVGSRVDGFVAHVASFREIQVIDIRPPAVNAPNIRFMQHDITQLPPSMWGVADSVSCLHALEHFGLGRYGDPIMPDGYVQGLRALWNLLAPGGVLYLSVPVGRQRIEFNAHRVFALQTILDLIAGLFDVSTFSYIDDGGRLHENASLCDEGQVGASFGLEYGCAIFELSRK
jgi:SAM-dependent methyltransferase